MDNKKEPFLQWLSYLAFVRNSSASTIRECQSKQVGTECKSPTFTRRINLSRDRANADVWSLRMFNFQQTKKIPQEETKNNTKKAISFLSIMF